MQGRFQIDRKIFDSWLWEDKPFTRGQAWIDLVGLAFWEDRTVLTKRNRLVNVKRGQVFTSIAFLADRWGWSHGKVERFLGVLAGEQMIHQNGGTDGTILTIENYSVYQLRRGAHGGTGGGTNRRADGGAGGGYKNTTNTTNTTNTPNKAGGSKGWQNSVARMMEEGYFNDEN